LPGFNRYGMSLEKTPDGSEISYTEIKPDETALVSFFKELFLSHWKEITFGPCLDGAVYEIRLTDPPKAVEYKDGYLTVDTGPWHFHLCVGRTSYFSEELAKKRQATRAAFFESRNRTCVPMSFGFRLWNGTGDQMISVFFPNPYLSEDMKPGKPDWKRLELWRSMKANFSGDSSVCLVPEEARLSFLS